MALNGAQLIQIKKNCTGSIIDVTTDSVIIGSDIRCDIRIHKSNVERKHCVIKRKGSKVWLFNYSSTSPVLVNDEPVLCNKELLFNDIITISNKKFLWTNNDTPAKTNYRRFTTLIPSGARNSLVKEDPGPLRDLICHTSKNRSSLPGHSRRSRSEVVTEKQIAMVKPLQPDDDEPVTEEFILPDMPQDAAFKHEAEILTKRLRSRSLDSFAPENENSIHQTRQSLRPNSRRLLETTSLVTETIKSKKKNILGSSSTSANKIERKLLRKALIARTSKVEKFINKNSSLEKESAKRGAIKRKLGDQEINICSKKRKVSQDEEKTIVLKNSLEQPDADDIYPDHAYSMVIPKKFKFGESQLLSESGQISQEQNIEPNRIKRRSSINEIYHEKHFMHQAKCPELNISITENECDNTKIVLETSNTELDINAIQSEVDVKSFRENLDGIDNLTADISESHTTIDLAEIEEYSDVDIPRIIGNQSNIEEHNSIQSQNVNNQRIINPILISNPQDSFKINETFPQTVLKKRVLRNSMCVLSTNEKDQIDMNGMKTDITIQANLEIVNNSNVSNIGQSFTLSVNDIDDQPLSIIQPSTKHNEIFPKHLSTIRCSVPMLHIIEKDSSNQVTKKNKTMIEGNSETTQNSNMSINNTEGGPTLSAKNITDQTTPISQYSTNFNEILPNDALKKDAVRCLISMTENDSIKNTTIEANISQIINNSNISENMDHNSVSPSNVTEQMIFTSRHRNKFNETFPNRALKMHSQRRSIPMASMKEKGIVNKETIMKNNLSSAKENSEIINNSNGSLNYVNDSNFIDEISISQLSSKCNETCPKNTTENHSIINFSLLGKTVDISRHSVKIDDTSSRSALKRCVSTRSKSILPETEEDSINKDMSIKNNTSTNKDFLEISNDNSMERQSSVLPIIGITRLNGTFSKANKITSTPKTHISTFRMSNEYPINNDMSISVTNNSTVAEENEGNIEVIKIEGHGENPLNSKNNALVMRRSARINGTFDQDLNTSLLNSTIIIPKLTSGMSVNGDIQIDKNAYIKTKENSCLEDNLSLQSTRINKLQIHNQTEHKITLFPKCAFRKSKSLSNLLEICDISEKIMKDVASLKSKGNIYKSRSLIDSTIAAYAESDDNSLIFGSSKNKRSFDDMLDVSVNSHPVIQSENTSCIKASMASNNLENMITSNIKSQFSVADISGISLLQQDISNKDIYINSSFAESKSMNTSQEISKNVSISETTMQQSTFTFNTSTPRNQKSSSVSVTSWRNEVNSKKIANSGDDSIDNKEPKKFEENSIKVSKKSAVLDDKDASRASDILEQKSDDVELDQTYMISLTQTPKSVNNSCANFVLSHGTRSSNRILNKVLKKSSKANLTLPLNFESVLLNSSMKSRTNPNSKMINNDFSCSKDEVVNCPNLCNDSITYSSKIKQVSNDVNLPVLNTNDKEKEADDKTPESNTNFLIQNTEVHYESTPISSIRRSSRIENIADMPKMALHNVAGSFRNDICEDQSFENKMCNDEQSITPKTTVRLISDVVKKQHSTAKKATPRHTLGSENIHPLSIISNKSRNDIHNISNINTRSSKILKMSSSNNVSINPDKPGVSFSVQSINVKIKRKLAKSSNKSPKNDLSDIPSIKNLFEKKVLSPKNDLSDISGVKYIMGTSSINLHDEISEIEQSMKENTNDITIDKDRQFFLNSQSDEYFNTETLFDLKQCETQQSSVNIDESFDNLISKPIIKKTYFNRGKTLSPVKLKNRSERHSLDGSYHNKAEIENWLQNARNKEQCSSTHNADEAYLESQVTDGNNGISALCEVAPKLSDVLLSESQVKVISNRRPLYSLKQHVLDDDILEDAIAQPVIVEQKYDHPAFTPTHLVKKDKRAIDLDIKYLIGNKLKFKKTRRVHNKKSDEQNGVKISDIRLRKCFVLLHKMEPAASYEPNDELALCASQNKLFQTMNNSDMKIKDSFDCNSTGRENTVVVSAKSLKNANIKEIQITNSTSNVSPVHIRTATKNMEEKEEEVITSLTRTKELIAKENVTENIKSKSTTVKRKKRVLKNLEISDQQEICLSTEPIRITRQGLKKLKSSEELVGKQINAAGIENESLVETHKQIMKDFNSKNKSKNEASSSSTVSVRNVQNESLIKTPIKRTRRAIRNIKNSDTPDYERTASGNNEVESMIKTPVKRTRRAIVLIDNTKNVELMDCERNKSSDVGNSVTANDDNVSSVKKPVRRNRRALSNMNNSGAPDIGKIDASCANSVTENDEKGSLTKKFMNQNRKKLSNVKNSHVLEVEKIDISNTSIKIDQKEPKIKKPITRNRRLLSNIKDSDVPDFKNNDVSSASPKIDEKEPVKKLVRRNRRVLTNMKNCGMLDLEVADVSITNTITIKVDEQKSSVKKPTKRNRKVSNDVEDSDMTDFKNIKTSSASKKIGEKEPSVKMPVKRTRRALSKIKDSDMSDLENADAPSTSTFTTKIDEKDSSIKKPIRNKRILSTIKSPDMPECEKMDASKISVDATRIHAKEPLVKSSTKRARRVLNDPICTESTTTATTSKNLDEESLIKTPVKRIRCALRNEKSLDETDKAVEDNNSLATKLKRNVKKTEARDMEEQRVKGPQTRSKRNK